METCATPGGIRKVEGGSQNGNLAKDEVSLEDGGQRGKVGAAGGLMPTVIQAAGLGKRYRRGVRVDATSSRNLRGRRCRRWSAAKSRLSCIAQRQRWCKLLPPPQQGCFMGFLHFSVKKACPRCGGNWVRRSHRKGAIEKIVCALVSLNPFRCEDCGHRYFRFRSTHPTEVRRPA